MGGCRRRLAIALASVAALAAFPAAVHADVRIGPSTIVVRGASGRATITRSPFRVSFADAAGRRVLRESPSTARTLTLTPPPPPLLAGYDPPLQDTLYAPLAFTVGTERTTARDSGQWSGNLREQRAHGHRSTARARCAPRARAGRGVRLVVATSDPSGRVLVVTIAPDRGGSLHVAVRPSPSQGVVGMADSFTTGRDEAFRGFGGRHLRLDQRGAGVLQLDQRGEPRRAALRRPRRRAPGRCCTPTGRGRLLPAGLLHLLAALRLPARPPRAGALPNGLRPPGRLAGRRLSAEP